ncbi:hypothetical protein GDO81_016269 [Engystomops pustulosus]|uniref:Glucagon / GIP / secretin / VIP family domain-containing protein n=1 Tax=Engystomops pustulosus TaxID=76066 RepID=A0AAV7AWS2_ENGPU|nr:hypothetical protein GDO81_016269 [Engystomops pustulosus]
MARLLISLMVLTVFIAFSSAFSDWNSVAQSNGVLTSFLSQLKNDTPLRNHIIDQMKGKVARHSDGLFTSQLSKIKNDIAVKNYLKNLLSSKRSLSAQEAAQESY